MLGRGVLSACMLLALALQEFLAGMGTIVRGTFKEKVQCKSGAAVLMFAWYRSP